jgi:hypothetical protein
VAEEQRPWHRLFALSWVDFFYGLPVTVEFEKDLAVKKQLLDVLLLRRGSGPLPCRLPDGFENFGPYNLVSFKSLQERLSAWTLEELLGHYVNVRKQVSPAMDEDELLPADQFRLYAVCARFPQHLATEVTLVSVAEGVYEVPALSRRIRVIVANQLPLHENNAMLHLFSTNAERLAYGVEHYRVRSVETSTLLLRLFQRYRQEGLTMPNELEEFARETIEQLLKELPVEKRLEGLTAEQVLKGFPVEKRLEGLSVEQILQGLSAAKRRQLAEKLKGNGEPGQPG